MPVKSETSTRFMDEIRILSPWAYFFASLGFLMIVVAAVYTAHANKEVTPVFALPVLVPLTIVGGAVFACFILLIGYVNADAGRRGMSRLFWTLIAIFIPKALGIVLYFVMRQPKTMACPQCSAAVARGFGFCPRCRYQLGSVCSHCQHALPGNADHKFCPYCGGDLAKGGNPTSEPVPNPA